MATRVLLAATTDQVGSPRLVTGAGGAMVSRHDYLPFGYDVGTNYGRNNTGQQNSGWGQTDYVKELFTGQLQDTETQFDWFRTRYYTYLQGRFHSPDPLNAGGSGGSGGGFTIWQSSNAPPQSMAIQSNQPASVPDSYSPGHLLLHAREPRAFSRRSAGYF